MTASSTMMDKSLKKDEKEYPMISILIHSYKEDELKECLASIFKQNIIKKFEVVFADNASDNGTWSIACRYSEQYPGKMTISRNKRIIGGGENRDQGYVLCQGEYMVELFNDREFEPIYIAEIIQLMVKDDFFEHNYIKRLRTTSDFIPMNNVVKGVSPHKGVKEPLVSICVYNFNYGRYLTDCLESVFNQTYENVELCFSDNASTDNSWEVALKFSEMYPGKVSLTKNAKNFGPSTNLRNCILKMEGKYVLKLTSDDILHPEFIDKCVKALEAHQNAAFAMVHRDIIDGDGNRTSEAPFYEHSCVIPAEEKVAVYMMSSVNPSISQILYNVEKTQNKRMVGNLNDRWFGDRLMDFHICCSSPIVYIKEPLLINRVHGSSDGATLKNNLLQCLGEYVLIHQLSDIASSYSGLDKAVDRLPSAVEKIGRLCLRYCLSCLSNGDEYTAKRYFHLAAGISPLLFENTDFLAVERYFQTSLTPIEKEDTLKELLNKIPGNDARINSYPVPDGSILC